MLKAIKKRKRAALLGRRNIKSAKHLWPDYCSTATLKLLRELTTTFGLSVDRGEIKIIDGRWYVTHSGLLGLATRRGCQSIRVDPVPEFSDPSINRWVFKSIVHKSQHSRGFVGFGDADPTNVSNSMRGSEMRIAETRAVNRALRKAYGIGLCSVEELGSSSTQLEPNNGSSHRFNPSNGNGSRNGQPKLRDRLCILIRKYSLDAEQVKRYAADFCGTEVLRDASRDLVESFIATLEEQAAKDIQALICKLNSYPVNQEVRP